MYALSTVIALPTILKVIFFLFTLLEIIEESNLSKSEKEQQFSLSIVGRAIALERERDK